MTLPNSQRAARVVLLERKAAVEAVREGVAALLLRVLDS